MSKHLEPFIKNPPLRVVFSTFLLVFRNVVKQSLVLDIVIDIYYYNTVLRKHAR